MFTMPFLVRLTLAITWPQCAGGGNIGHEGAAQVDGAVRRLLTNRLPKISVMGNLANAHIGCLGGQCCFSFMR